MSTTHYEKLKATLENLKLPTEDRPVIENALKKYKAWKDEINNLKESGADPEIILQRLVDSFNSYKKFIEIDVIFKSRNDFLYRQKGQLKLDNSIIEEFLPELIHRSVIPEIKGLDIEVGPIKTFSSVYFKSSLDNLSNGPMLSIKSKDQDFAITKKIFLKTSFSSDFTDNNVQTSSLAYIAAECKTNLDKTMFQEASATAHDVKTSVPGAKYFLLCEWLDMTPVSTAPTDIDEVIILRKAKRLSSNIRREFSTYEGRMKNLIYYTEYLETNPISLDMIKRFIIHIQKILNQETLIENDVLSLGFF